MARSYRELLVWQKAKALAVHAYKATANFPRTETYGLFHRSDELQFQCLRTSRKGKAG